MNGLIHVVRIVPNSVLLTAGRALAVARHETWLEAHRYLDMDWSMQAPAHGGAIPAILPLWTTLADAHPNPPPAP